MYDYDALRLVIDQDLLAQLEAVEVDYRDSVWRSGFSVSSSRDVRTLGAGRCC